MQKRALGEAVGVGGGSGSWTSLGTARRPNGLEKDSRTPAGRGRGTGRDSSRRSRLPSPRTAMPRWGGGLCDCMHKPQSSPGSAGAACAGGVDVFGWGRLGIGVCRGGRGEKQAAGKTAAVGLAAATPHTHAMPAAAFSTAQPPPPPHRTTMQALHLYTYTFVRVARVSLCARLFGSLAAAVPPPPPPPLLKPITSHTMAMDDFYVRSVCLWVGE